MKPWLVAAFLMTSACGNALSDSQGDAAVWVSVDGVTWSRVNHPALGGPGDQQMTGVTRFGDLLVAVGINRLGGEVDGRVWLSEDGEEWRVVTDADLGGSGEQWIWSVIEAGPGLIAVGEIIDDDDADAVVWTSGDGVEWNRVTDLELGGLGDQRLTAVIAIEGTIIAAGSVEGDAAIWMSPDGISWSKIDDPGTFGGDGEQWISDLTTGGPGLVAVGADGTDAAVWASVDGSTWERIRNADVLGGDGHQEILSISSGEHGFIAVGSITTYEKIYFLGRGAETTTEAAGWASEDGLIWVRVKDPTSLEGVGNRSMYTVTMWGSTVVAAGIDSADPRAGEIFDAPYDSGQDVDAAIWLSTDGRSWTKIRSPALGGDDWQDIYDIVVFGDSLVAVGGDDRGSTSD